MQNNLKSLYDINEARDACGMGLFVDGKCEASHSAVEKGIEILKRLAHRGACGADGKTGDGAGILLQIPDAFFRAQKGFPELPARGRYAVASVFLPRKSGHRERIRKRFQAIAEEIGMDLIAQRKVPVQTSVLGAQARLGEPVFEQWFLSAAPRWDEETFKRNLFILRQAAEKELRENIPAYSQPYSQFYIASLSHRTLVYKGLLQPEDLAQYYSDLSDSNFKSAFAMVHSRFSTNTLPSWELAHPYRMLCHNGEINTLKGNLHWMRAREKAVAQEFRPEQPETLLPLIRPGQSDSQSLDNLIEVLVRGGRSLPHALLMAVPEVWETLPQLSEERKAFNQFHSLRLEPWDGPAALGFTDGDWIGACLDRNGLRPCRYQILTDGTLILSSETGVLDYPEERIATRGRLGPGEIIGFHLGERRLYLNQELRESLARLRPYAEWTKLETSALALTVKTEAKPDPNLAQSLVQFGYTAEEVQKVILPMLKNGEETASSMGNDTPLAVLSDRTQLLFKYFRQMFAQVTNPPIDPERERLVMSLTTILGPRADLFSEGEDQRVRYRLESPFLSREQMESLKTRDSVITLPILFVDHENSDLSSSLKQLCALAADAVRGGATVLILSDASASVHRHAIPSLLAVSAVHHHLIAQHLRTEVSLVVHTGEARDVHHFACLIGFGASAVHSYLLPHLAARLRTDGDLPGSLTAAAYEKNYIKALEKGLRKILSKMGISTLPSYCGAQIFEILGLGEDVCEYFPTTPSPIGGMDLKAVAKESQLRQSMEPLEGDSILSQLPLGGDIHFRSQGEVHFWNPTTIAKLQIATRKNDPRTYEEFREAVESLSRFTLRGLLEFRPVRPPLPLEQVEPVSKILRRFSTGAMSFGALGKEAHETLALAMNQIGAKSNSGEGGEDAARFTGSPNGESKNSAIKQVASGRFGVTSHYLANARELQIKMAQGAKPGEGGQLPGHKVDAVIAKMRHSTPGVTLISPPPHHDIYSIEDLAQLIFDLKNANPKAAVSVKLVAENGVGTIAAGVAKAHADKIVIGGDSGGTGASPLSSIKYAGSPWEIGLAETQQALVANGLRSRVRLEADGQLKTGRDVVVAALLGADEYGFSTAPLIVEGCVMMRKCHLNTCPVGVATQDPELRAKFEGKPEYLIRYFHFVAEEVRQILSQLGFRTLEEAVGRVDCLISSPPDANWKASRLDLSRLIASVETRIPDAPREKHFVQSEDHRLTKVLDHDLITLSKGALEWQEQVQIERTLRNEDRSVGVMLSYHVSRKYGAEGLPANTIRLNFQGVAGQSLGAFLAPGISLQLEGAANDYVGKGLSGGSLRIFAPVTAKEKSPVLLGNTCLYGATSGELFAAGKAGERFAVRNSGALAVVEGVGEHGCEYMTGGRVIVLGATGKNFAAGMSGGLAFVYDAEGKFAANCNMETIELGAPDSRELNFLRETLRRHRDLTGSELAQNLLRNWLGSQKKFIRVLPLEYKKVLLAHKLQIPPAEIVSQEALIHA